MHVWSSKTRKLGSVPVSIPLLKSSSRFCPVRWVTYLYKTHIVPDDNPLFSTLKLPRLSYSLFNSTFKVLCKSAGLSSVYSSHSLCRGGATLMSDSGIPLVDVKDRGCWASDAVFRYITPSLEARKRVDKKFSSSFDLGLLGNK